MAEPGRHHDRLSQLFLAACDLDPAERSDFLARACAGDPDLLRQVERMLGHDRTPPASLRTGGVSAALRQEIEETKGAFGHFKILRKLGEGGMAIVLLAEQERPVRRRVAIKVTRLGLETEEVLARFELERQALARLNHPHVAQIYEAGVTDRGRPYFVMEYVDGDPITKYCDRARLDVPSRLALLRAVCDGVEHAHERAIIHRDITPSNVLVTVAGGSPVPKVIDFGIAKALDPFLTESAFRTSQGGLLGTPAYMSPERFGGDARHVDTRTDVYSLGALLYEILAGRPPRTSGGIEEQDPVGLGPSSAVAAESPERRAALAATRSTEPARLARELRGELDWITLKAIDRDPARRYRSPADLADDLARYLEGEAVLASPPSRTYRLRKIVRKHWVSVSLSTAIVSLLVASSVTLTVTSRRLARERDRASQESDRASQEAAASLDLLNFTLGVYDRGGPFDRVSPAIPREGMPWNETTIEALFADRPLSQARVLYALSRTYEFWDDDLANEFLHQYLRKLEEALGPGHPDILEAKYEIGRDRLYAYRLQLAEPILQEVFEDWSRILGANHAKTLGVASDLAWLAKRDNRTEEGVRLLEDVLARQRLSLGASHPDTLVTTGRLGGAIMAAGRYREGRAFLAREIDHMRRELGDHHTWVLASYFNIACASSVLGDQDPALRFLKAALEGGFIHAIHPDEEGDVMFAHTAVLHDPTLELLREDERLLVMIGEKGYLHELHNANQAVVRGERDTAVAILERMADAGLSDPHRLTSGPLFTSLRHMPAFQEVIARVRERSSVPAVEPEWLEEPTR